MEGVFGEGFCSGGLGRFDGLHDMVGDLVDAMRVSAEQLMRRVREELPL